MRLVARLRGNGIVCRIAFSNVHLRALTSKTRTVCRSSAFVSFGDDRDNAENLSRIIRINSSGKEDDGNIFLCKCKIVISIREDELINS